MKSIALNIILLLSTVLFVKSGFSQKVNGIQQPAMGAHFFMESFRYNDSGNAFSKYKPGLAVNYLNGISLHTDIVTTLSASFANFQHSDPGRKNHLFVELDGSARYKLLPGSKRATPYLQGGIGVSYFNSGIGVYTPLGVGIQGKLIEEVFLLINAQYRAHLLNSNEDHFYFSIGIAGTITKAKQKKNRPTINPSTQIAQRYKPVDTDGDGIYDSVDACPLIKGFAKYKGCPIPDTDGDGINDEEDSCPRRPGILKYKGCPIPDTDGDGINDEDDRCPDLPGVATNHGCPMVEQIIIEQLNRSAESIFFKTGSYDILPVSFKNLDTIAKLLKTYPKLNLVIEGHTDSVGTGEDNLMLSQSRANAVVEYFKSSGIDNRRMHAFGYGMTKPIASNSTNEGRSKNRRVVLTAYY